MKVDGEFFDLTDRFKPASAQVVGSRLVISVPKRLLRSAVRRNTVKRLVREAWRSAMPDCRQVPRGAFLVRLRTVPSARVVEPGKVGGQRWRCSLRADIDHVFRRLCSGPRNTAPTNPTEKGLTVYGATMKGSKATGAPVKTLPIKTSPDRVKVERVKVDRVKVDRVKVDRASAVGTWTTQGPVS